MSKFNEPDQAADCYNPFVKKIVKKSKADLAKATIKIMKSSPMATSVKPIRRFIDSYLSSVALSDISELSSENFFGLMRAHWKLAKKRQPGETKVNVYNPSLKQSGWDCEYTVIEVINDDMPFLVDSVFSKLSRLGLDTQLVLHPIFNVMRSRIGKFEGFSFNTPVTPQAVSESFMHFQVSKQPSEQLVEIRKEIFKVIKDVSIAVEDWVDMRATLSSAIEKIDIQHHGACEEDIHEVKDFLKWVHDDHFTFLGYQDYDFVNKGKKFVITSNKKSSLGIFRNENYLSEPFIKKQSSKPRITGTLTSIPRELITVNKTDTISNVHRAVHMDSIGILRHNKQGKVIGQKVFVGLFTSGAYCRSPHDIPMLRLKLKKIFGRSGFASSSHDGKALLNILETYPLDELFQASDSHLFETALGILHLKRDQRVALFIRCDDFERFVSCIVYVPKDNFTTDIRKKIQKVLESSFAGEQRAYYTQIGDNALARLHIIIKTKPGNIPRYKKSHIEADLLDVTCSWGDSLLENLTEIYGKEKALNLYKRYNPAFLPAYKDKFRGNQAAKDIENIEQTLNIGKLSMSLFRPETEKSNQFHFKVYHPSQLIPLSDVLPILEDLGLRVLNEIPYVVHPDSVEDKKVVIHDFGVITRNGSKVDLVAVRKNFQDTFSRAWSGEIESDGFNALVLFAGLGWREVMFLRACCKYLRQVGVAFSQEYMEQTLTNNAHISCKIVDLFEARFDPSIEGKSKTILKRLEIELEKVKSADEDRILRRYINLVMSMLRTNFYQTTNNGPKPYLSFKFDSEKIDELPLPRPFREIYVYSPKVEGIHLRFGMVARGGLRWSDRREDFRTEVLGLVKAQQVKNTVIVPVGSKGGFVVKNTLTVSDRNAFQAEGIECYKLFISGLLDLTDNLRGKKVIPPKETVRKDRDDPYLVVAADKGTATFSDIANSIAIKYGFWLGDAFASGGSDGYDHKKMGITARGGWESVKRHFREMGINTQRENFDVIGVGDMSGDVFGNGMLLSSHICLIGAFNHQHIFVDPEPDAARGIVERKRLFRMQRSSWTDYNLSLISKGGGIFDRSAKSIELSPEIQKRFNLSKTKVTPNELIRALLMAKADLLWFGGIGTYLKNTGETHFDVGDRANDAIRINANQLNVRVVGEGANLGVTQRGRVQAALNGVRIYADSIDNSAGVDCSDHEVNIKILIDQIVSQGSLTKKQRNSLLAQMTEEVGQQVLVDNYNQTLAINMILYQGMGTFDNQVRLMRFLEKSGRLNREVEFLPNDEVLIDRGASRSGLTGPEIAVLMSYAKIWISEEILASDLPDDITLQDDLVAYFPTPLRKSYKNEIINHRLSRQIIATQLTNSVVNRAGGTFIYDLMERTGKLSSDVVKAYNIAWRCLGMGAIWSEIDALDNKVSAAVQTQMRLDTNQFIEWVTLWFLRNGRGSLKIGSHVDEFFDGFKVLYDCISESLPKHYLRDVSARAEPYIVEGVPENLAIRVSGLVNMFSGCDILRLAETRKLSVLDASRLYFAIGSRFHLGSLRAASNSLENQSHWQKLATASLIEEIYGLQLTLAGKVLDSCGKRKKSFKINEALSAWIEKNKNSVERTDQIIAEIASMENNDFAMLSVASRQLRSLADASVRG